MTFVNTILLLGGVRLAKSLFKAVVLVAFFSILTRLLGFLFRIYLSRELGAELLGVYHVAFSIFMVFVVLVSSGIPLAVSKLTAVYRVKNDKKAEASITTSALIVGLAVAIFICAIILIFQNSIGALFTDNRTILIIITLLPAIVASAVYSAFRGALWGTQNYFSVCWTELAEQIVRIIAFFVLASTIFDATQGAITAGVAMSVACVASAILVMVAYFADKRKLASPRGFYKPLLRSAMPVTGVRAASSLIQPLIAVLFPLMMVFHGFTNEQAMSLYGIAMGMTFPLLFLPSTVVGALSFALIPELSTALAKNQQDLVKERIKSSLLFSTLVSALFIPFFMGAGEGIGVFLYDNATSGVYLSRAAWVMIPLGLSNITSSILNSYNLEVRSFIHNVIGGVALILCVVCLSGVLGVDSLIWGFGICMLLTTGLNLWLIKRHTGFNLGLTRSTIMMLLFIIPSTLLCHFTYNLCIAIFNYFFTLCVCGIVSIASFLLLCWVFKIVDISFFLQKFVPNRQKAQHFAHKK